MEDIRLVEPTPTLGADFRALAAEFLAEGDDRYRLADVEQY